VKPGTPDAGSQAADEARLRRGLVLIAAVTLALAVVHLIDHAIRGQLVVSRGLDPAWNHSGWPAQQRFSPFTVSLFLVLGLLTGGILLTLGRRVWARYWLLTAIVLGAIVVQVHFLAGRYAETPGVILGSYDNPLLGVPAVAVTFAIVAMLLIMGVYAVRVGRRSGRW
jgi:hypothetical protein